MSQKGFSLIEMQISLVISAILVLTIGVMSKISLTAEINKRHLVQNNFDLAYALRMAQNKIRPSSQLYIPTSGAYSSSWNQAPLYIDNGAIGLIDNPDDASIKQLVYVASISNLVQRDVLIETSTGLNLSVTATDSTGAACVPVNKCKKIQLNISGTKDSLPFNVSSTISRRPT